MADLQFHDWMEIGRIVAPHGLDGSVRVYPSSDFPERFLEPGKRWICKPGEAEPDCIQLLSGRYLYGKGLYILKFAGLINRDQAEILRDAKLLVPRGDRLPIEPDEFHIADLIGLQVRMQETGVAIGTVVDVYSAGNDLLAVKLSGDRQLCSADTTVNISPYSKAGQKSLAHQDTFLVPFVYEIVPVVNLNAGYVEITPPKGLLPNSLPPRD